MLCPQHHQSGYATNQSQRTSHQREPTAVVLFSAFWAAVLAANFCSGVPVWPPDGLLQQSASRPAGCRHSLLCTVHGCPCPRVAICVPLSCASASATSLRAASQVLPWQTPLRRPYCQSTGNPDGNQRPRGCCHIINITGKPFSTPESVFVAPLASFAPPTRP